MIDPEEFGKAMGSLIKEATAPLLQRIDQLEKQLAAIPAPVAQEIDLEALAKTAAALIPAPADGVSVTLEDVQPMLDDLVAKAVAAIPAPEIDLVALAKSAADLVQKPADGKSVTVEDVLPLLADLVSKAVVAPPTAEDVAARVDVAAIAKSAADLVPKPADGTSVTVDDVRPMLTEIVKALPAAEPGKDADMVALKSHLDTLVKAIEPPAPPTVEEIAGTFERRFSDLTLSWERQARDTFEKAADRMPKPQDGRDALALENFDMSLGEDGRTVTVTMKAGDTVLEKSIKIAAVIDRETFKHDGAYEKGDGVSYGGSFWIAKCDNPQGVPGSGETDWRCAVKKGRDGKDLRENASTFDPAKGVKL